MSKHSWRGVLQRITTAGPYTDEWFTTFVLSLVVVVGILSIAATDRTVEPEISVASLYFLPLALGALLYPLRVGVALSLLCLAMHHIVSGVPKLDASHFRHDAATLAGYLFVVIVVNRLGQQRIRLAKIAQRERDELAGEIRLAAEVQQNILPRTVPSILGFDISAKMYPAKTVAGDYYGFIEQPDGSVISVIADVSGKGVSAGLLMPSIEIALRLDLPRHANSKEVLQEFNRVVYQLTGGLRFISLFYGRLFPTSRRLEYTNAGHNPALLVRNGCTTELSRGGPVLGVLPEACYETEVIQLERGDVLVLYTDGIVEAENSRGEFYSAERLKKLVLAAVDEPAHNITTSIYDDVRAFRGSDVLADDATLIIMKVL
jgi:serine phosphatase RsbU (regulator of sigma subunit)